MKNQFVNFAKSISIGNPSWDAAKDNGLLNIAVKHLDAPYVQAVDGHRFIDMCSCSYLGLDTHPEIVKTAADAVLEAGTLNLPTSRVRIRMQMLDETEDMLSQHFNCESITTMSCGSATAGVLPVLASGHLTNGVKPVMIFDKFSHFSMQHIKPICGDETEVLTCKHNDLQYIEDECKKGKPVAYIADGAYSMGGHAPVEELLFLQEKYGLFLYFDDSHSLSAFGNKGEGYVRSFIPELNDKTIIVASLAKGFGACGGVIFLGPKKYRDVIDRFGGPMSWSQYINPACMGAIMASVRIHASNELAERQKKLQENIKLLDSLIPTADKGNPLPIRVVPVVDSETSVEFSHRVYKTGFYTSAVFFPIVARGTAGLRVMARADMSPEHIKDFCQTVETLNKSVENEGV